MTRVPTISTYNNNKEEHLSFTLENCNVSIANAIRRVVLSDINTYVFKTFPHAENRANFTTNTTHLHNELLKQRLGCIPIHHVHTIEGFQNDYKNYIVEVDIKNESDTIRYVTTEDFKVKRAKNLEKTGGSHDDDDVVYEYLSESTVRRIFPPDSVSGEYIEFARLLPKLSSNVPCGEALAFTCTIEISNAKFDGMYNVAHTCSYSCTPDENEIEKQWKAKERGLREGFESGSGSASAHASANGSSVAEQLASAKKNWELLDAQRISVSDSFDFVIETVGVYTNVQLVTKSCDIMIKKCEKLLADMEHSSSNSNSNSNSSSTTNAGTESKIGIKNIIEPANELTTMKNAFCINLIGEDYTLGKVIEYLLFSNYYDKPDGIASFCGFKKPHPHALDSFILVAFKEETELSKVQEYVSKVVSECISIFKSLFESFNDFNSKKK
jgi:DNA-directed RNA polymerase subunit L